MSITSNLIGNLVWTYLCKAEKIEFAAEEDEVDTDTDTDDTGKNSKRSVNLLEEDMQLTELSFNELPTFFNTADASNSFCCLVKFPIGKDRKPLENPPEKVTLFS